MIDATGTILERLVRLDTCALSDALDRLSMSGALAGFPRWGPRRPIVGQVITVALEAGPVRSSGSHLGTTALSEAGAEQVIVVANAGQTEASAWGGLLSLEAHLKGVAGVIVDGALRDVDEIEDLNVPVFARCATPRSARGRYREVATNVPVTVGGLRVEPGTWVVADGSGVVFIPRETAAKVLPVAEDIADRESRMASALREGNSGTQIMDSRYEQMLERGTE
jgi:regulator of RNase E activity RraA